MLFDEDEDELSSLLPLASRGMLVYVSPGIIGVNIAIQVVVYFCAKKIAVYKFQGTIIVNPVAPLCHVYFYLSTRCDGQWRLGYWKSLHKIKEQWNFVICVGTEREN